MPAIRRSKCPEKKGWEKNKETSTTMKISNKFLVKKTFKEFCLGNRAQFCVFLELKNDCNLQLFDLTTVYIIEICAKNIPQKFLSVKCQKHEISPTKIFRYVFGAYMAGMHAWVVSAAQPRGKILKRTFFTICGRKCKK